MSPSSSVSSSSSMSVASFASSAASRSLLTSNSGSPLSSPATSPRGSSVLWHCPFECGQQYKRSSGRSIRRHVNAVLQTAQPGYQRAQ